MTRLFDLPDPNPGKLLQVAIAVGVPLWMELLDEKTKSVWIHTRTWSRTDSPTPLDLVALAMAEVALELFRNQGEEFDKAKETVQDYAGDYLRRLVRFGPGFTSNVRDLGDELAHNYSSCITLNWGVGGGAWYVVLSSDNLRMHLLRAREDALLVPFIERYAERYPQMLEKMRGVSTAAFAEFLKDLSKRCDAAFKEIYETQS